jgi:hypothetical protein
VSPKDFKPTEVEALLITLAGQLTEPGEPADNSALEALEARFGQKAAVEIVAYGAGMLATNVLNTTLRVPLDDDLAPHLAA